MDWSDLTELQEKELYRATGEENIQYREEKICH